LERAHFAIARRTVDQVIVRRIIGGTLTPGPRDEHVLRRTADARWVRVGVSQNKVDLILGRELISLRTLA
jgi:hypothetical protein